jgi:catechol 2,3-dioxygenase-like lactoylglutathione lyase family enzyme
MAIELRGIVTLLEVFSVPRSITFYCEILSFELVQSAGAGEYIGWAWLRHGDVQIMLNAMFDEGETPMQPDAARVAAHRDTTLYIGCPDVDGAYRQLHARNIGVAPPTLAKYGMKQLSFADPDGYRICLQCPV